MGDGILSVRPPPCPERPPYITVSHAMGGWSVQCIYWNGQHEDCWATGELPFRFESEAREYAQEWADAWGIAARLPSTEPDPAPAADLLTNLRSRFPGMQIVQCDDASGIDEILRSIDADDRERGP